MIPTLLQSKVAGTSMGQVVFWSVVLVAVITVGLVVVSRVKRRLQANDAEEVSAGFSLSDLRRMRDEGEVSAEEYDKARSRVIDAAKRAAEREQTKKVVPKPTLDLTQFEDDDGK